MDSVCYYAQVVYDSLLRRRSEPALMVTASDWLESRRFSDTYSGEGLVRDADLIPKGPSPISNVPPEILDIILEGLDIRSQKRCRLVSQKWNSVISTKKSFQQRLCHCHVESEQNDQMRNSLKTYFRQSAGAPPLGLASLRLRHVYSFWNHNRPEFFQWMNVANMAQVTWLEIQNSQLKVHQLLEILGEFVNLKTLRISGDTIIHNAPIVTNGTDENADVSSIPGTAQLRQLAHLELHFEDLHNFLITLDRLDLLIFEKLETLDLRGDAGNTTNAFRIGPVLDKLLRQNARTLKVLRLDNFSNRVRGALDSKLSSSKYELRSSLYAEFPRFASAINWRDLTTFPSLEEISFQRFPVAYISDAFVQESLVSLFSKAPILKRFSISQVYFSDDTNFQRLATSVPRNVILSAISVHLSAPAPNPENIVEVMHCEQNILKYQEASVNLKFENIDWTIIYLTWPTLISPALQSSAHLLKKLTLKSALFPIGDTELQYLIREAANLEELTFDNCDLLTLTDSGITGLSQSTVNKMWTDRSYQPSQGDFSGESMQNLTKLHTLKLANVGTEVTHISILNALLKMQQLNHLTIYQNQLTIRSTAIEMLTRQRNIFFKYEKPILQGEE